MDPRYGGNKFNLFDSNIEKISIIKGDVRDIKLIQKTIEGIDVVYHFAAQVSYIDGLEIPYDDLEINAKSTLILLEAIRKLSAHTRIIFSSSRMVYGKTYLNPVLEDHPTEPLSLYAVHKLNSEKYLEIYYKNFHIPYTVLRITNPYGKKQQMRHNKYSILGWFVRRAMENKSLKIFGDGQQKRDYIYVDDIVNAFTSVIETEKTIGETYNLGSGTSIQFQEMVHLIVKIIGRGLIEKVDWPNDYENIETGDFEVSIQKLKNDIGWRPEINIKEGILRTYEYYTKYSKMYF